MVVLIWTRFPGLICITFCQVLVQVSYCHAELINMIQPPPPCIICVIKEIIEMEQAEMEHFFFPSSKLIEHSRFGFRQYCSKV